MHEDFNGTVLVAHFVPEHLALRDQVGDVCALRLKTLFHVRPRRALRLERGREGCELLVPLRDHGAPCLHELGLDLCQARLCRGARLLCRLLLRLCLRRLASRKGKRLLELTRALGRGRFLCRRAPCCRRHRTICALLCGRSALVRLRQSRLELKHARF